MLDVARVAILPRRTLMVARKITHEFGCKGILGHPTGTQGSGFHTHGDPVLPLGQVLSGP